MSFTNQVFRGLVLSIATLGLVRPASATVLAYWRFDEGTSGNAITSTLDTTGNAFNALTPHKVNGGVTYGSDVPGPAITDGVTTHSNGTSARFNGTTLDHLRGPAPADASLYDNLSSFTLEGFFKAENVSSFGDPTTLFGIWQDSAAGSYGVHLYQGKVAAVLQTSDNGAGYEILNLSLSPLANNTWYHIAYVHSPGSGQLYVNYQLVASNNSGKTGTVAYTGGRPMEIGGEQTGVASASRYAFGAWIDNVRLSNVALSTEQMLHAVPEPCSLSMMLIGVMGIAMFRRKRDVRGR